MWVFSVLSAAPALISLLISASQTVLGLQYASLRRYYGPFVASLVSTFLPDTAKRYERVERVLLQGKDGDALAFRQAVTDECNMTTVAVGRSPPD